MAEIPSQMDLYMQIFAIQVKTTPLLLETDRLKNLGDLSGAYALNQQEIALLKEQLRLTELLNQAYAGDNPNDLSGIVRTLSNALLIQADLSEALSDFPGAEALRSEALALSHQYLSAAGTAETERQRAAGLIGLGRFNEALTALVNARDQFESDGSLIDMADVTTDIAGLLEWLGDYERARLESTRATQLIEGVLRGETVDNQDIEDALAAGQWETAYNRSRLYKISVGLNQLAARIARYTGRLDEAEQRFTRALGDLTPEIRPAVEVHLAAIAALRGQYQVALDTTDRIIPGMKGLLRPKLGVVLRIRADALLGLGNPQQALPVVDQAIQDMSQFYDPDSLWKILWLRGRVLEALNRPMEALQSYLQATDVVNNLRKSPLGFRLDSTYLADKLPLFVAAIQLAAHLEEAAACCDLIEKIKSRILTATISIPEAERPKSEDPLVQEVAELSRRIDTLEYAAFQEGWTAERKQQHETLLSERSALLERIRFSDPRWRSLSQPVPFNLRQVQQVLASSQQAAVELFYQPGSVVAVLVSGTGSVVRSMPIAPETAKALETYTRNLEPDGGQPDPRLFDISNALGVTADRLVPAALLEQALQAKCLVIVPHGPLHLLPWAGLLYGGKRLFEYCPVGILPSLSCLVAIPAAARAQPKVAIIGSPEYAGLRGLKPLPLAAEEVSTIQDIYQDAAGLIDAAYMGKSATQASFWGLAKHPDSAGQIFHIACHGSFDREDPANSGLLLEDGKIDAAELALARLTYDEVILSACSTGHRPTSVQGVALAGDDILGLPGAFLEAGARAVLVSIPPANDMAALSFMTLYHEFRAEGIPSLEAIQRAQKEMLANVGYPAALWIGFTLYGHAGSSETLRPGLEERTSGLKGLE